MFQSEMRRLLFFLFFFVPLCGYGQSTVSPLDVSVQFLPPYSVFLPDMAAPGSERLRIQVVQRDLMTASYDFFLVLEVEHQGRVLMRT
ncbi:MAG: hypothetical protein LBK47_03350, partial [Prevotellaceae bacterium]|nr:hypothetical protein [Prevotellaceae bacterium]